MNILELSNPEAKHKIQKKIHLRIKLLPNKTRQLHVYLKRHHIHFKHTVKFIKHIVNENAYKNPILEILSVKRVSVKTRKASNNGDKKHHIFVKYSNTATKI